MENKNEKLMGNFIETLKNSKLPTNAVFNEVQYPTIRTTVNTSQTPILQYLQTLSETSGKLNQIEKLLKKICLYNTKYLLLRNRQFKR